jgi:hypothetical protein
MSLWRTAPAEITANSRASPQSNASASIESSRHCIAQSTRVSQWHSDTTRAARVDGGQKPSARWDALLCVIDGSGAGGAPFEKPSPMDHRRERRKPHSLMTSTAPRQHAQDQCPDARRRSCVDWDKWPSLGPSAINQTARTSFGTSVRPHGSLNTLGSRVSTGQTR